MKFNDFLHDQQIQENGFRELHPQVSIIMPTYARHAEGLLESCIESVLNQTYKNFEFIVIDDGSTDGSEQVLRNYAIRDPRIVYVRHNTNSGLPAVRTDEGILLARAPYIAFIFDDNRWNPTALERLMTAAEGQKADIVHGQIEMPQENKESIIFGASPVIPGILEVINTIPNGAVLCRKDALSRVGLYDPHLIIRRICDWDLWRRASRAGLTFVYLPEVIGTEHGAVSRSSLGNTVSMDYKVSLAYISDTKFEDRNHSLLPETILTYDMFDQEKLLPHVRDLAEFDRILEAVYQPYFAKHTDLQKSTPIFHNRRYDVMQTGYRLNSHSSIFKHRKRILLLANIVNRVVLDWVHALSRDPDIIPLLVNEWSIQEIRADEIDGCILFDAVHPNSRRFTNECHQLGIPVIYVAAYGCQSVNSISEMNNAAYLRRSQGLASLYHPDLGAPWREQDLPVISNLLLEVDQIVVVGSTDHPIFDNKPKILEFTYCPKINSEKPIDNESRSLAYFAGDPERLDEKELQQLKWFLEHTPVGLNWKIFQFSGCSWPNGFDPQQHDVVLVDISSSLTSLACQLVNTILVIPERTTTALTSYHLQVFEEDLAINNCVLYPSSTSDQEWLQIFENPEKLDLKFSNIYQKSEGYPADARLIQLHNILMGTLLRKKIAQIRNQSYARDINVAVLINSQALAGSEVYGLLVAKALSEVGFKADVLTPASFDTNEVGIKNLNAWLAKRSMKPVLPAEYGKVNRSFHFPVIPEKDLIEYSRRFSDWLKKANYGLVFSSGFLPEPLITPESDRLVFMALFAPWDYFLGRMAFMRENLAGLVSDTNWAARLWGRWLPPPVAAVPSWVEPRQFRMINHDLNSDEIQIAVTGTIQPRKRQKIAVMAVMQLINEGFKLHLNLYGYKFAGFSAYIDEINTLVKSPALEGHVTIHGFVEDEKQIAAENHIILSTSADESLPQSTIFSQAAGLIAVATPVGGVSEMVIDGQTGYLSKGFSVDEITDALRRALLDQAGWPVIRNNARRLIAEKCSGPVFTQRLLKVMNLGTDIHISEGRRLFASIGVPVKEAAVRPEKHAQANIPIFMERMVIGPLVKMSPLEFTLKSAQDNLSGLQFQIGTFYTQVSGQMFIQIVNQKSKEVIREIDTILDQYQDNSWVRVQFSPIEHSQDCSYLIRVTAKLSAGRFAIYEQVPRIGANLHALRLKVDRKLWEQTGKVSTQPYLAFFPIYRKPR